MTKTKLFVALFVTISACFLLASILVSSSHAKPKADPWSNSLGGIQWQIVPATGMNNLTTTYRAKVPGGWIVTTLFNGNRTGTGMTFIPDGDHSWNLHSPSTFQTVPLLDGESSTDDVPSTRYQPRRYDSSPKEEFEPRKTYQKTDVDEKAAKE